MAMAFPTSQPTREDVRIQENRGQMGAIFFRKEGESRGLGSGSIVELKGSKLIRKCEKIKCCLLTSDKYFPARDIGVGDYFFEYWSSDLKTVQKLSLRDVAQSDVFYQPTAGLALIPVCPTKFSKLRTRVGLKSSVLDERRTFPTRYHSGGGKSENKQCFIVGSYDCRKESLTVERFTLITERDDQGQLQHRLRDDVDACQTIFQSYDDIIAKRSHLYPRGAVILEGDGPQATCIGILNFTEEGLISPVFFTPETFTGQVQLYYPTLTYVEEEASSIAITCSDGMMKPNSSQISSEPIIPDSAVHSLNNPTPSQAPCPIVTGYGNQPQKFSSAGADENQDGASLTNDDQTVYPDDYTLQNWRKLYEEVEDENTKLKEQSERDQQVISLLKDANAQLRIDIKKTEQQNEELRAENEDLRKKNENLTSKNEELCTKCKELRKDRDAESEASREDYMELHTENEQLKTKIKELRENYRKLRAENFGLLRDGDAESKWLREVYEELLTQNNELKTKYKQLLTENEELSSNLKRVTDQLGELLNQPNGAVCEDDTSSIKDSNNVKAEEPSGSSANIPRQDLDGSCKEEEPFLDSSNKVVSDLD